MSRSIHTTTRIALTALLVLAWSMEGGAADESRIGGLYRGGQLVDSFVGSLPPQVSRAVGLNAGARPAGGSANVQSSADSTQELWQQVQRPKISAETQRRNRDFARMAEVGVKLRKLLLRIDGRNAADESQLAELTLLVEELDAALTTARWQLDRLGERVAELGLDPVVQQRHHKTVQNFEAGSEQLRAVLDDVLAGKGGALKRALQLMERYKFREDPPLLSSGLPFQSRVVEAPTMSREQADSTGDVDTATAAPLDLPPPVPDDLAETPDVQLTAAIIAKAAELGNAPQAIYEFVRNQVTYEPYLGSRKGAAGTLAQLRGNDTDQASLLIALLRASNISSRYVRGTVEMDPAAVMSWVGVDDAAAAAAVLTTAGLDGVAIFGGPEVVAIRSTQVWVEAYVPYGNYRGATGDDTGPTWIPLDPSFKGSIITPGQDVLTPMGFDVDTFLANYISTFTGPSPLEQLELDIQAYLDVNQPGTAVGDVERRREIAPQMLGLLPATPPYRVLAVTDRLSELEDSKRYKVRFHLYDGGTPFIDHTVNLMDLVGAQLTIEYVGATPADQATIDTFGTIYETPPNLVNVKPVLELDGTAIATSTNAVGMGFSHSSDMEFIEPAGGPNVQPLIQNEIIAGNGQAIAFDSFLDVHSPFLENGGAPDGSFLEYILQTTAVDYLSRVDRGFEQAERQMQVVTTQDVSEAIVASSIAVAFSFGTPITFDWTGLTVDADRRIVGTFDVDGDGSRNIPFMKLTGAHASILENRVFEDLYGQDAISTIKILELASDAGIGICTISTSVFGDCPAITQPAAVIAALNAALAQGHVITIPEDPITVGLWSGTGYIDLNPATGAGGYIISGGISSGVQELSGGATVDFWPLDFACDVALVEGQVDVPPADSPHPDAVFCANDSPIIFEVTIIVTCQDSEGNLQPPEIFPVPPLVTHFTTKQFGPGDYTFQLEVPGAANAFLPRQITIGTVAVTSVAANPLILGEDATVNYDVMLPAAMDSARLEVENNGGTVVFKQDPVDATSGAHMAMWPDGKWSEAPNAGAFANPNNGDYNAIIKGMFHGEECNSDPFPFATKLVVEADITDPNTTCTANDRPSGLEDVGDALKIVMSRMGSDEAIVQGGGITVTDGADACEKHIKADDPALNSVPDGDYNVLFRDLRDTVGNFSDQDGNPANGIQEIFLPLVLK